MSTQALITSRDPKGLHAVGLFETACNQSKLDDARAQRLNERGGELQNGIVKLIAELTTSNQYANEEIYLNGSNYYPMGYEGPKPIKKQIAMIAEIFDLDSSRALDFLFIKNLPMLPNGAEGWFAIPSIDALVKKCFPEVSDPNQKYCQAVQLVHAKIMAPRSFYNCRAEQISPAHLRIHTRMAHTLDFVAETQMRDILIAAIWLGMRHWGKSVRRNREVFVANKFGLGVFTVGIMLLTHPEREVLCEQLHIDCAGDEFSLYADGDFSFAPFYFFHDNNLKFGAFWSADTYDDYGTVSGFSVLNL